jgi:hypothetical protein
MKIRSIQSLPIPIAAATSASDPQRKRTGAPPKTPETITAKAVSAARSAGPLLSTDRRITIHWSGMLQIREIAKSVKAIRVRAIGFARRSAVLDLQYFPSEPWGPFMRISSSIAVAALVPSIALAGGPARPTGWNRFNAFALSVSRDGSTNRISWNGAAAFDTGDLRLDLDQTSDGARESGTALVVGGQALVAHGMHLPAGNEIDVVDAAVLSYRLVCSALAVVFPEGPDKFRGANQVEHVEWKTPLRVGTQSGGGRIPVPWFLRGAVSRQDDGTISFDFTLSPGDALAAASAKALRYTGTLRVTTRPPLDDSASLNGWQVFSLGPRKLKQGGATTLDYGASARQGEVQTIGGLRAVLAAERAKELDPGKPDATKDFTGFWKWDCADNHGLRIQRTSKKEPYTVVFCGPGGCGDDDGRRTFITGDSHYQVVGSDEIREKSGDDWKTLRRCAPASAAGRP